MKEKCDCGKLAVWYYMPDCDDDDIQRAFCDDCVPRGCSCNEYPIDEFTPEEIAYGVEGIDWEYFDNGKMWRSLDNGKEDPCCEYFYNENGWRKNDV